MSVRIIVESGNIPLGNLIGFSFFLQENKFKNINGKHKSNILTDFRDSLFILQIIETDVKILIIPQIEKPGYGPVFLR